MRKLNSQLTSIVVVIVLVSSLFALVISDYLTKAIFPNYEKEEVLILGLAAKEFLMPVIVIILSWIQLKIYLKSIINPISDLTQATIRISSGDFNTQIRGKTTIKELDTLQTNFNMMARELRNNEMLKRNFISSVSHEFKTPLAVIKGYADIMCDESLTKEERLEYARIISNETERLSHLTSNMLKMTKLNNQEIIVSPKQFSLDEQIRRSVLMLMNKMNDKNIEIDVDLLPTEYTGDEELLSQVWLNLIDNAIKYTHENGKIKITAFAKPNGDIIVTVKDNGIGMSEATSHRIFDQFYQADKSHSKEGNGLGLSIVSRIIKLHGGNISVKSKENKGSEFRVLLPHKEIEINRHVKLAKSTSRAGHR